LCMSSNQVDPDLETQLQDAKDLSERAYKQYREKWKILGVDGRLSLTRLREDPYLQLRMNAQILKRRIRERLRHRKFELERLERAYRCSSSGKRNHLV
jgi:hypothetical protein